jgi:hypothetical protein
MAPAPQVADLLPTSITCIHLFSAMLKTLKVSKIPKDLLLSTHRNIGKASLGIQDTPSMKCAMVFKDKARRR